MTHKRFMQNPATERRIINGALWFLAGCLILVILTSCSPFAMSTVVDTATPSAAATARQLLQAATIEPTPAPLTCIVSAGSVYLREGAGMIYAAIDVLHKGERLIVLHGGAWLNVQTLEGIRGFIYGKFCQ